MLTAETVDSASQNKKLKACVGSKWFWLSLWSCCNHWSPVNLRSEGGLGHERIEYSVDVEGRFLSGVYLRGLWCCTHRLRVGCAVVSGLLAVVLRPGSAVVWLASRLGGGCCCRSCGLRGRLTWRGKQERTGWYNSYWALEVIWFLLWKCLIVYCSVSKLKANSLFIQTEWTIFFKNSTFTHIPTY